MNELRQINARLVSFCTIIVILIVLLLISVLHIIPLSSQPQANYEENVPDERLERLTRGVNVSHWFRWVEQADLADHYQEYITPTDIWKLRDLGVRHVRIPIDFDLLVRSESDLRLNAETLTYLNASIELLLEYDIAVIVTPAARFDTFVAQPENIDSAAQFWHDLASELSQHDPDRVFFQVANEPALDDIHTWQILQGQIIQAIRDAAPGHTIITATPSDFGPTGTDYDPVQALALMEPYEDHNIIYNFHLYAPTIFTHQNTDWAYPPLQYISGLTYPSSPENAEKVASRAEPLVAGTDDKWVPDWIREYGNAQWNAERIEQEIAPAVDWQNTHQVPIIVDEFGIIMKNNPAPAEAREQWFHDTRNAFESHGFGWTMWEYEGEFGFVQDVDNERIFDPFTISALFYTAYP